MQEDYQAKIYPIGGIRFSVQAKYFDGLAEDWVQIVALLPEEKVVSDDVGSYEVDGEKLNQADEILHRMSQQFQIFDKSYRILPNSPDLTEEEQPPATLWICIADRKKTSFWRDPFGWLGELASKMFKVTDVDIMMDHVRRVIADLQAELGTKDPIKPNKNESAPVMVDNNKEVKGIIEVLDSNMDTSRLKGALTSGSLAMRVGAFLLDREIVVGDKEGLELVKRLRPYIQGVLREDDRTLKRELIDKRMQSIRDLAVNLYIEFKLTQKDSFVGREGDKEAEASLKSGRK